MKLPLEFWGTGGRAYGGIWGFGSGFAAALRFFFFFLGGGGGGGGRLVLWLFPSLWRGGRGGGRWARVCRNKPPAVVDQLQSLTAACGSRLGFGVLV